MEHRHLAILLALPGVLLAQPARLTLQRPDATLAHEFTRLESIRELRDGRLLVSDPRDRGLVVVDFRSGQVNDVSHTGRGPGEYSSANSLFPLAGDSTLMADYGNRRWLLFYGDRVIGTVPPDDPAVRAAQVTVTGADSLGHVMSQRRNPPRPGPSIIDKRDSTTLVLVMRVNGKSDTVTAIRRQPGRMEAQYDSDGKLLSTRFTFNASVAGEMYVLCRDGWLAVVRLEPYRVDWRSPAGKWTLGSPLPVPSIPLDAREKRAEMERRAKEWGTPVTSPDAVTDWPATLPPFRPFGSLLESSDGRLLVPRQPSADHPETTYDIVNRRGQLDAELTLPPSEHIIGFGRTSVYVVAVDVDGIQRLRRHPWAARR